MIKVIKVRKLKGEERESECVVLANVAGDFYVKVIKVEGKGRNYHFLQPRRRGRSRGRRRIEDGCNSYMADVWTIFM